jgi:8-oxo-dGTP diphosphatase
MEQLMARTEGACAILIDTHGRFLMQQRDDIPGILYPDKVGLFAGHREDGESFLECVVREVEEEIGYSVPAERFTFLASFIEPSADGNGVSGYGELFVATDIPTDGLKITEGALLIVSPQDIMTLEPKFSPETRVAMNTLLKRSSAAP